MNRDQLVSVVYDAFFATAEEHDQSWIRELPMLWAEVEPVLLD